MTQKEIAQSIRISMATTTRMANAIAKDTINLIRCDTHGHSERTTAKGITSVHIWEWYDRWEITATHGDRDVEGIITKAELETETPETIHLHSK